MGRTHLVGGAVAGALVGVHAGPWGLAAGAAMSGLSGLAADVNREGTPAARVPLLGWILSHVLHHRGVTHSVLTGVLWWAPPAGAATFRIALRADRDPRQV